MRSPSEDSAPTLASMPPPSTDTSATKTTCFVQSATGFTSRSLLTYLAEFVRSGPPLHEQEFLLTETMLLQLARAGLRPAEAALAYHALIELSVASAAIDAPMALRTPETRASQYSEWRSVYAELDPLRYPASVAHAPHLYASTADDRFEFALDRLLDGLEKLRRL